MVKRWICRSKTQLGVGNGCSLKRDANQKKNTWNEIVCNNLQLAVCEQGNIRCKELTKDILNNTRQNILLENPQ